MEKNVYPRVFLWYKLSMKLQRCSFSFILTLMLMALLSVFMFLKSSSERISPEKCRELGIPVLFIDTYMGKPIKSKENYVDARYEMENLNGKCKVRGHGNTTWTTRELYKRPYLLNLEEAKSLLGMNSARKWILVANTSDKTFLRNHYGYWLSKNIWKKCGKTPEAKDVFLFLNGKFNGIYSLTEKIEMGKGRLEFAQGSFLATVNNRLNKEWNFTTSHGVNFSIRMEGLCKEEYLEMQDTIQKTEDSIYSGNWKDFIDTDSFVDWYILNEYIRNKDSNFVASCYMHWDNKDQRMHMGPVWDMDLSSGNVGFEDGFNPEGWWVRNRHWFEQLLKDPEFKALVVKRWRETKAQAEESLSWIDSQSSLYKPLVMLNETVWKSLGKKQWPHAPGWKDRTTYESEVQYMKNFLERRLQWIDRNLD